MFQKHKTVYDNRDDEFGIILTSIQNQVALQSTAKEPLRLNNHSLSDTEAPEGFQQESYPVEDQVQ